ncbi:hypothetical protein [Streptomyces zagrosensis]|uniref:Uncharacterized protein n=1 Tax=Streptomyces zagrosensis TaxID=1042984 RepID=A0A7W9UX90_9ACTN|nr:hypothetical protein [Streptomyces zagrosensis]MBB5933464.1 hypothetical protein [Streptomyces zagrosensis]
MGWAVLYCAFGVVALWLLGEVLLQYKARLRWRLLAFGGFLCVVVGVVLPSVLVIAAGAAAFAVGQTYVTLSFRRGFATGWSLRGGPDSNSNSNSGRGSGGSKRRRGAAAPAAKPTLRVSDLQAEPDALPPPAAAPLVTQPVPTYQPQPLPDDTDGYGIYSAAGAPGASAPGAPDAAHGTPSAQGGQAPGGDGGAADAAGGFEAYAGYAGQDASDGQHGYPPGGDGHAGDAYGYGAGGYAGNSEQSYGSAPPPTDDPYAYTSHPLDAYGQDALNTPGPYDPYGQPPAPAQDGYAAAGFPPDGYPQAGYDGQGVPDGGGYPEPQLAEPSYSGQEFAGPGYAGDPGGGYGAGYDIGDPGSDGYGQGGYPADGYGAPQQYPQTPSDGVWVPQQRDGEMPPGAPPAGQPQPYPYDPDYRDTGHDEQYRY